MTNNNSFNDKASELIERFSQTRPMHANSLLLSIYGDTISPRSENIWLGSLIKLVAPVGISQRLVRTSVFRLSEKGILQSMQSGRRSYYSLTNRAYRQFVSSSKRIYASKPAQWDQQWRLVFTSLNDITMEQREIIRKELYWLGFNRITVGVYGHPVADMEDVKKLVQDLGMEDNIVMLQASACDTEHVPLANTLISQCFDLSDSSQQYSLLIDDFQPLLDSCGDVATLEPKLCFLIKTLLMHRYRHILLKEPDLPDELLPSDAVSRRARKVTGQLYKILQPAADLYFSEICEQDGSVYPPPPASYFERFKDV
ncbi:PaaX family transcriptional regulator [Leucothrix mucor]|uniref:PaaX family transcriptional regulator n=1 Tax=Leucothrix mucor TaxID=45248 RepID=UPI0003B317CD|nr:PaaX family transcriptional regulator C-terminal domain-containing protein [Leucothrix mucor]